MQDKPYTRNMAEFQENANCLNTCTSQWHINGGVRVLTMHPITLKSRTEVLGDPGFGFLSLQYVFHI